MTPAARLIALDWGTSNLRAALLGAGGRLLQARAGAAGVMAVPERRFAQALEDFCGDWIRQHGCPLIASGMIGSRQGWQEAPYLECPAGVADAAARLTRVEWRRGAVLHIVPGLHCIGRNGQDDVMRGEETQLWGASLADGRCCVLPGTHSKWAWTAEASAIARFETCMTGELYALLTQHGILGRLMTFGEPQPGAFERGARLGLAEPENLMHSVFAARTAGLFERETAAALPDFLSGILIGAEIGGALRQGAPGRVTLIGDAALCERYATALRLAGVASERAPDDATARGQWRLALAAGLVEDTP